MKKYVLGIDQSTQGTKGIIFDGSGKIIARTDLAHDQIINEKEIGRASCRERV